MSVGHTRAFYQCPGLALNKGNLFSQRNLFWRPKVQNPGVERVTPVRRKAPGENLSVAFLLSSGVP